MPQLQGTRYIRSESCWRCRPSHFFASWPLPGLLGHHGDRALLSPIRLKGLFAQPQAFWRDFANSSSAMNSIACSRFNWRQGTRRIASSAVDARILVSFFSRTTFTSRSVIFRVFANNHALVDIHAGADEKLASFLQVIKVRGMSTNPGRSAISNARRPDEGFPLAIRYSRGTENSSRWCHACR